mgnify:CR=1 FL=1
MDFHTQLLKLSALEQAVQERNEVAQVMMHRFHELFIQPYEREIAAGNKAVADLQAEIKAAAREAALDGEVNLHSHIEVKRKPVEWDYDEKEVLKLAIDLDAKELIRTKFELNKVPFKQGLNKGDYPWAEAKMVKDVIVTIRPLGDLPIIAKHAHVAQPEEG